VPQKESYEQNKNDAQMSTAYSYAKVEHISFGKEDKDVMYDLISTYFYETSLLFRMASMSVPTAISMKKIVEELPDKRRISKYES
jgi:hypothetical protein